MITRRASCSCGQLSVTCKGEPVRLSMCHCLACQQRTGSVFAVQARFPRECVETSGTSSRYERIADSGNRLVYNFCPQCGATVFYGGEKAPDIVAVPVGAFADSAFPPPTISVWEARAHAWSRLPDMPIEHQD